MEKLENVTEKVCIKSLAKGLVFICLLIFFILEGIGIIEEDISRYYGDTTEKQIISGFQHATSDDYNCYILGNSKIYRGINPDKLYKVNAYNFGHDNEAYNQMYYKLLYLWERNRDIEVLILGTDYNAFSWKSDTRNHVYDWFLGSKYISDYGEIGDELYEDLFLNIDIQRDNLNRIINHGSVPNEVNHIKSNGQYIVYGHATENDKLTNPRDGGRLDFQVNYLKRIVDFCQEHSIELYILIPPSRDIELDSYGWSKEQFDEFDSWILSLLPEKYKGNYYNLSDLVDFKDYTNYVDSVHLNEEAADRFSEYIDYNILSLK